MNKEKRQYAKAKRRAWGEPTLSQKIATWWLKTFFVLGALFCTGVIIGMFVYIHLAYGFSHVWGVDLGAVVALITIWSLFNIE